MNTSARGLALIGLLGGFGGAIVAYLSGTSEWLSYDLQRFALPLWVIIGTEAIPRGFITALTVFVAGRCAGRDRIMWFVGLYVVGWSWSCLYAILSTLTPFVFELLPIGPTVKPVVDLRFHLLLPMAFVWLLLPFSLLFPWGFGLTTVWVGLGGVTYYCGLTTIMLDHRMRGLAGHILLASLSGWLSYLPWLTTLHKPWHDAVLYGTIWGALVGFGVWKATREDALLADDAVFRGPVPRDLSRDHDRYLHGPN